MSTRRAEWAVGWCRKVAEQRSIHPRDFREALGRLCFIAGPLMYLRPFLGPLYSWLARLPDGSRAEIPPMIRLLLRWIADKVATRPTTSYLSRVVHVGAAHVHGLQHALCATVHVRLAIMKWYVNMH